MLLVETVGSLLYSIFQLNDSNSCKSTYYFLSFYDGYTTKQLIFFGLLSGCFLVGESQKM
jgi:hypothetical protein